MSKTIWIVKGIGEDNPEKIKIDNKETVGSLRASFAKQLKLSVREIELTTDTKRLLNDSDLVVDVVEDGETINVLPRAKAGKE